MAPGADRDGGGAPRGGGSGPSRFLPAIVPLAVAVLAAWRGNAERAVVLAAVGVVVAILVLVGVPIARWIEQAVRWVLHGVSWALFSLVHLVAFVPGWAWSRLRHHGIQVADPGWSVVVPAGGAVAEPGRRRSGAHLPTRILGVLVLVAVLDYAVGWTWDRAHPPAATTAATGSPAASGTPGDTVPNLPPDPRSSSAAMAGAPWAERYFADLRLQTFDYWPFTEDRPRDLATPYIHVKDWRRRSWNPEGTADGRPVVWFFGGSAMFGEGRRDEHTVPSEVARLAEKAGIPIRVANYGQRGWVHFQEMFLYEQQLALHPAPSFAVFYDGPNDLQSAALFKDPIPTNLHADEYAVALRGRHLVTDVAPATPKTHLVSSIWAAYRAHSATVKVAEAAGLMPTPASAEPADGDRPAGERDADRNLQWGTEDDGRQGLEVYERGRFLTEEVSARSDVTPFFFWQPVATHQDAVTYAQTHLTKPTIDLTHVFDGRESELYIDTTHTNEAGAALVAEAMWKKIEPKVRAWYRTHP